MNAATVRQFWSDCELFWQETRGAFATTGALLPSSPFLARALAAPLHRPHGPVRVLEVGPGTGAITRALVRCLRPGDRLDAVELNERFVARLERLRQIDPLFAGHRDRFRVIHAAVQELPGRAVYDHIVSGLPLNNFPPGLVRDIFRAYRRLLVPGGVLSYFEYAGVRHLKAPFVGRDERLRLRQVGRVVGRYIDRFQRDREAVLLNVPPALVRHLHFPSGRRPKSSRGRSE